MTPSFDPIGPGTPAWEASEAAIYLWHEGRRHAAGCAMARMITHLRSHGVSDREIQEWKGYIYNARLEAAA